MTLVIESFFQCVLFGLVLGLAAVGIVFLISLFISLSWELKGEQ